MSKRSFLARLTGIKTDDDAQKDDRTSRDASVDQNSSRIPENQSDEGEDWVQHNYEGQLSVDVYQTENEIVIKSAVAGVEPRDLDISISNDMITIKGTRELDEKIPGENYFYQECYWGQFSRSIILPQETDAARAVAEFKTGILTIRLPKAKHVQKIHIKVEEES